MEVEGGGNGHGGPTPLPPSTEGERDGNGVFARKQ